jgi:hypothetical protein
MMSGFTDDTDDALKFFGHRRFDSPKPEKYGVTQPC